jgi:hypothetical protein
MHQGHLTFERRPIELSRTALVNIIFFTARPGLSPSRAGPGPPPGLWLGPQEMEAQARAFRPSRALQNTRRQLCGRVVRG